MVSEEKTLKNLRNSKNVSQRIIATELGFSRPFYTMLENGRRKPSLDTVIKLADYFQCSIEELLIANKWK